ncbi:MAG: hypothetical protein KJZ58_06850 [Flavobacteriales bacterium]|nr:hypothetical protein [Flavobacteriales bacterium]MCL4281965.1 hypothetical protein [Flavobacteriales bacterium]
MQNGAVRQLFEPIGRGGCALGYAGAFPDELTSRLLEVGGAVMDTQGIRTPERGRLSYVMVEAYQNVVRHRAHLPGSYGREEGPSHFMLCLGPTLQAVGTMNPVESPKATELQDVLGMLKTRTTDELKALFREGIQREHDPTRRGAGLGLIEMIRRSGATPQWKHEDVIPGHTLFSLVWGLGGTDPGAGLEGMDCQHEAMRTTRAWLTYCGPCTPMVVAGLSSLLETESGGKDHGNCLTALLGKLVEHMGQGERQMMLIAGSDQNGPWLQVGLLDDSGAGTGEQFREVLGPDLVLEPSKAGTWVLLGGRLPGTDITT